MKKVVLVLAACSMIFSLGYGTPLYAQEQIKLSGPHFTLNIIGVNNDKEPTMTDSNRHTIFVRLGSKSQVATTNIWLQPGYDFKVCDGNGFDPAYNCSGDVIKSSGATFQLPCNLANTYYDPTNDLDPTETFYGCPSGVDQRSYYVYARALGKPFGEASMKTCAYDAGELFCSTEVLVLKRTKGKSIWQLATSELTSINYDVDGDGFVETIALFVDGFEDLFWQYDNKGLKHAQIRFYPVAE